MQSSSEQAAAQERLEILLAMALTFNRQPETDSAANSESTAAATSILEQVSAVLSALNDADLTEIRAKVGFYENLDETEKRQWQARVLSRVNNQNLRLDKDVHYTQVAEVLRSEPDYICGFILGNLSEEMRQNIIVSLDFPAHGFAAKAFVNHNLEQLLRRRFLTSFVTREDLSELKPLAMLSGGDILKLLQQIGRSEIALVCRGIKEVENLAPFLRQFPAPDAKIIVEEMIKLRSVERRRIDKAETLVHEAWQTETDSTLVVQQIGLRKLAAAFAFADDSEIRFTLQKLPLNLSKKLQKMFADDVNEPDFVRAAEAEVETTAARILLEKTAPAPLPSARQPVLPNNLHLSQSDLN